MHIYTHIYIYKFPTGVEEAAKDELFAGCLRYSMYSMCISGKNYGRTNLETWEPQAELENCRC